MKVYEEAKTESLLCEPPQLLSCVFLRVCVCLFYCVLYMIFQEQERILQERHQQEAARLQMELNRVYVSNSGGGGGGGGDCCIL